MQYAYTYPERRRNRWQRTPKLKSTDASSDRKNVRWFSVSRRILRLSFIPICCAIALCSPMVLHGQAQVRESAEGTYTQKPTSGKTASGGDAPTSAKPGNEVLEDVRSQDSGLEDVASKDTALDDTETDDTDLDDTAFLEDENLSDSRLTAAPQRGNAIQRQNASIRRQLGGRPGRSGGFFISSWFSDAPAGSLAAPIVASDYDIPEECDPLDLSIAEAYIRDSALREGVSLDLVREMIRHESGFNPCAVSPKGAMGLMQLMPDTASALGVSDPFNPRENIDGGVRLMRRLLDKYQGRPDLALAAYNAGEGAVDTANGIPNFAETKEYVAEIMKRVFETPPRKFSQRTTPRVPKPETSIARPVPPTNTSIAPTSAAPSSTP